VLNSIESAKLKLVRATEHIKTIRQYVAAYAGRDPHRVTPQPHGTDKISVGEEPPPQISILTGEVIYQLRSIMDHLAFDLVKMNSGNIQLPADWEECCFFPLWLDVPKKSTAYNCFSHTLPGIPKQAFAFIEGVQPYRGGAIGTHLRLLANLSNIDKHRYPNLTKARLSINERITTSRGWYTSIRPIDDGTELGPVADTWLDGREPVEVERRFTSNVSFAEPILDGWTKYQVPVEEAIQFLLDDVNLIIVPAFDEFFNNP
jgi:hypothetical protein